MGATTTSHRWPDEEHGPWLLVLSWHEIDGRPECTGLRIEALPDPAGVDQPEHVVLTGSVLRRLKLPEIVAADRAAMAAGTPPQTAAMRRSTVERLETAARLYREALRAGLRPNKAVAEHYGITPGGASNLIARARAAGLLPPTSAGVPMG